MSGISPMDGQAALEAGKVTSGRLRAASRTSGPGNQTLLGKMLLKNAWGCPVGLGTNII